MGLYKILKIVTALLGVLGLIFFITILTKGEDVIKATGEGVDGPLYFAYFVLGLVVLIVLAFALKGIFSGDIKKTLVIVGSFVLITIISFAMAKSDVLPDWNTEVPVTETVSKRVGAVINMFYIIVALAFGVALFGGVKKLISK